MGRIKSTLIKRTAKALMLQQDFTQGFEENKKILGSTMPSKRIKNILAGYITRLERVKVRMKPKRIAETGEIHTKQPA